jgi:E3 ubiquitin-protein ligase HUWE1
MFIIRQIVVNLDSDNVIYTAELVDAILSLISTLITSQNGGNTIVSAGIMPILVQMLENRRQAQMRVVSRVLTILDSILYGFHQSFEAFIEANGLDIIVTRIEEELGRILSCVKAEDENLVSPISPRAVSCKNSLV